MIRHHLGTQHLRTFWNVSKSVNYMSAAKRTLRSASIVRDFPQDGDKLGPINDEDIPSTPKKKRVRQSATPKSPKKKTSFKQREAELLLQYPIPSDLSLPESFKSLHQPEFVKGLKHVLTIDPSLYPLIVSQPFGPFHPSEKPSNTDQGHFEKLCRSVIGQQVSGAAARSIEAKFVGVFNDKGQFPTPQEVINTKDETLRSAGLSVRKTEYIKSICQNFIDGEISQKIFENCSDQDILEKLVSIKGIGEWSAKMFLTFALHKLDVFASDDLGVARGISRYLESRPEILQKAQKEVDTSIQKKKSKFDDGKKRDWKIIHDLYVQHIAKDYAPYRSLFMLICWRASSTNVDVLSETSTTTSK